MSDEESHDTSYETSAESVGDLQEGEEGLQEEVDIKKAKFYRTLTPMKKLSHLLGEISVFYVVYVGLAGVLVGLSYVLEISQQKAFILHSGSEASEIPVSMAVRCIGMILLGMAILDGLIYYVSGYLLERVNFLTLVMFHINGVTSQVSGLFAFIVVLAVFRWKGINYKLSAAHNVGLNQVITNVIIGMILVIIKDISIKRLRIGFNHTNYLTRIQKCLLEYQFVKVLEAVKKKVKASGKGGRKKSYWMFSQGQAERPPSEEDTPDALASQGDLELEMDPGQTRQTSGDQPLPDGASVEELGKLIKPKQVILPGGNEIGVGQKMIIFKEFEKIMNTKVHHMEVLGFTPDLKNLAQKKAEKISYWLSVEKKKFQVKHLKKYVDEDYIDTITRYLGMSASHPLGEKEIFSLLERTLRERSSVKKSLVQMDKALLRVSRFSTVVIFIFAVIGLCSSMIEENQALLGVVTTLCGAGFIFQSSAKNAIDSIIFLFIVHPYDIGDRVYIELEKGVVSNMVVTELNVFSTVFYRWDGAKIYVPNHLLLQKAILNIRRSGAMAENIKFQVSFDTPTEKLQHLKNEIGKFIKKHPKDFTNYFMFNYDDLENTNKLHVKIFLQHNGNWQSYESYLQRKAKFIMFLKGAIADLNIEYYPPIQRVELVN